MKFLKYILSGFSRVMSVDAEFLSDSTGTIPRRILCLVFKDIKTGEIFRYWVDKQEHVPHFFDYERTLFISFSATAEHGVFQQLHHGKPKYMWDCFVENKCLYLPFLAKNKIGLIDTCGRYNIDTISKEQKDWEQDRILRRNEFKDLPFEYSLEEQQKILDYCQSDVEENAQLFIAQCQDIENKNKLETEADFKRALYEITFRGYSQANFAQIERNGFTVDTGLVNTFNTYWPLVKETIIERYNKKLDVYEGLVLKKSKFDKLVLKCGLGSRWPRLKSGNFTTNDDVLKRFETEHELINEFRQLQKLINTTKLGFYEPSEDGRVRANLNGFGSITSRCQPSNSKYPLGASKWARNFIKPQWGHVLYYLDYSAQEPAIAGFLSKDPELLAAYQTPDLYINTAQKIKMITDPNATKETHEVERNIVKDLFLAQNYGMGAKTISKRLGCSLLKARGFLNKFHNLFKVYNRVRDGWIDGSAITGHLRSPLGWQRWILGNKKWKDGKRVSIKNQLKNFIIQTTGADILRKAIQKLHDNNIRVMATLHDAVLIEVPTSDLGQKDRAKSLMELAAKEIVGGVIRVDEEAITSNWKQKPKHQKLFDEIFNEIEKYKKSQPTNHQSSRVLEAR